MTATGIDWTALADAVADAAPFTDTDTDYAKTPAQVTRNARAMFRHYDYDRHDNSADVRVSCGICALNGYEPRGGWGDGHKVKRDGPNYAGWGRLYVEAMRPIPAAWRPAFIASVTGADDPEARYVPYMMALRRDVATYGVSFTDGASYHRPA